MGYPHPDQVKNNGEYEAEYALNAEGLVVEVGLFRLVVRESTYKSGQDKDKQKQCRKCNIHRALPVYIYLA